MPTIKQKQAVKKLVENGRTDTLGNTLQEAGYSKNTSKAPTKVTKSKGFQEALDEAGLTDDFLNKCLSEDIKKKPQNRKAEVELAYKLKGRLTDKIDLNVKAPKPLLDSILDDNGEYKTTDTDKAIESPKNIDKPTDD